MKKYKEEFDDADVEEEYGGINIAKDKVRLGLDVRNGNWNDGDKPGSAEDPDDRYKIETMGQRNTSNTLNGILDGSDPCHGMEGVDDAVQSEVVSGDRMEIDDDDNVAQDLVEREGDGRTHWNRLFIIKNGREHDKTERSMTGTERSV